MKFLLAFSFLTAPARRRFGQRNSMGELRFVTRTIDLASVLGEAARGIMQSGFVPSEVQM